MMSGAISCYCIMKQRGKGIEELLYGLTDFLSQGNERGNGDVKKQGYF